MFQTQDTGSKTHPVTECSRELDDIVHLHVNVLKMKDIFELLLQ